MCPTDKNTPMLSDMENAMENYGVNKIRDELQFCGGKSFGNDEDHDQSKTE